MTYMLDTNICSFLIRRRPPSVAARLAAAEQERQVFISAIVAYELLRGALGKPRFGALVDAFLASATVMPWDQQAAARAAQVHHDLTTQGRRIGENDTMIAGHALATGSTLITNNTREFARVAGLKVEDWS
jgi:tRNA(fMet)-specific endonuclease VapC